MGDTTQQWGWNRVKLAESDTDESVVSVPSEPSGTFIGSGALFEGTLKLRGNFQIDSEFRGELRTEGKIVIGPSGSVVGDIRANEVEVLGAVLGDVSARRVLVLRAGSRLHGTVTTACLEIERHAFFNGTTVMTEPQRLPTGRAQDAASTSDSSAKQTQAVSSESSTAAP
jgi:cytoskeletal protein CcmA (bactofilin family)